MPASPSPSLFERLVAPHPSVASAQRRRRARMLATLLLAGIPLQILAIGVYLAQDARFDPVAAGASLALLLAGYALTRSPRYELAAWLTSLAALVGSALGAYTNEPGPLFEVQLYTLSLAILLAAFLISVPASILFHVAVASFLLALPRLNPEVSPEMIPAPLWFSVLLGVVSFLFGGLTRRDLAQLEDQATQITAVRDAALEASRAKSRFLANVSHDLRTPLTTIIGYADLIAEESERTAATPRLDDVLRIRRAGRHLLTLVNDVLHLAKIEAGRVDIQVRPCSINEVLEGAVASVESLARSNHNALEVIVDPGVGTVHLDPLRLRQVLENVLSNACKFTENGQVRAQAYRDTVDGESWLLVEVTDTGRGMSREEQEHLFDEFWQAEHSDDRNVDGTGLGLAISRHFCVLMGGDIRVHSEPGRGSRFTVRLPVRAPERV